MVAVRILSWIARLSGLGALALGLLIWFARIDWLDAHVLFGTLVSLSLLALSVVIISIRGGWLLGASGILYAILVPVIGEMQVRWYVNGASWLVPTIHMLIGIGAVGLAHAMSTRYTRLKGSGLPSSVAQRAEAQTAK